MTLDREACGIDLGTVYVVTGGLDSQQRVTQYSLTGEVTELPHLVTERYRHACSKYVNNQGVTVSYISKYESDNDSYLKTLLVTGGFYYDSGDHYLSTTEILTLDSDQWMYAAPLPSPRAYLSATNVGNSVLIFGKIRLVSLYN